MTIAGLLDGLCDIYRMQAADPEDENSEDGDVVAFAGVPCRDDALMRIGGSFQTAVSGGEPGIVRTTFLIQDSRLDYPINFNEENTIRYLGRSYDIVSIGVARTPLGVHHYEVVAQAGSGR
jgi:hypothetical protein